MERLYYDPKGVKCIKPKDEPERNRVGMYAVIHDQTKRYLLVHSALSELWEFPGGQREEGETAHDTIRRKVFEETGYAVATVSPHPIWSRDTFFYDPTSGEFCYSVLLFFEAQINLQVSQTLMPINKGAVSTQDKILSAEWVPVAKLNERKMHPLFAPLLGDIKHHPIPHQP